MKNTIRSFKFIYPLIRYNFDNYPKVLEFNDTFKGVDGHPIPLKILSRSKNFNPCAAIIFPGASPDAEKHKGMLYLGSIFANMGYTVYIPRIPPLKDLQLNKDCVNWFAHCYNELLKRNSIDRKKVIAIGMSFGGGLLLKASLDERISKNPPRSFMTFGTYNNLQTTLKYLCTGELNIDGKSYFIKPHEWGLVVLLHNFFDKFNFKEIEDCRDKVKEIIALRIADDLDKVEQEMKSLPVLAQSFLHDIFDANVKDDILDEINRVIGQEQSYIEFLSPEFWVDKINNKVFIMHGSNDSMVPYTESIELDKNIKDSSLFISYMYEHKEISTNRGILFKVKEIIKMFLFFRGYFKYNES